jgi:hypothetical protein
MSSYAVGRVDYSCNKGEPLILVMQRVLVLPDWSKVRAHRRAQEFAPALHILQSLYVGFPEIWSLSRYVGCTLEYDTAKESTFSADPQ